MGPSTLVRWLAASAVIAFVLSTALLGIEKATSRSSIRFPGLVFLALAAALLLATGFVITLVRTVRPEQTAKAA